MAFACISEVLVCESEGLRQKGYPSSGSGMRESQYGDHLVNSAQQATAVVFAHEEDESVTSLADSLRILEVDTRVLFREQALAGCEFASPDMVFSLGSDWSLVGTDASPKTKRLIECELGSMVRFVREGIPIFGVCFGAQLLASVLGGSVRRGLEPEIGWTEINSSEFPDVFNHHWLEWHYDEIVIPSRASVIASNSRCTQAFTHGKNLGVQFHPEADLKVIKNWLSNGGSRELAQLGLDAHDIESKTREYESIARANFLRLLLWYLKRI